MHFVPLLKYQEHNIQELLIRFFQSHKSFQICLVKRHSKSTKL